MSVIAVVDNEEAECRIILLMRKQLSIRPRADCLLRFVVSFQSVFLYLTVVTV